MRSYDSNTLAAGWTLQTIPELVDRSGVFADGDWVESRDQDPRGDVRLVQLADVGDGVYRDRSARFLTTTKAKALGCTFLQAGDVLIARMPDPLGRACIFPGDTKPSVTVVDVCIVRSAAGCFDHRWLSWFVNAPLFRTRVAALQAGSTRKRVSRRNLGSIKLPVPPPDEQHAIADEIEKQLTRLDAAVVALRRVQGELKRYRAAVLKAACEGRLVPTEAELADKERRDFVSGVAVVEQLGSTRRDRWDARGPYKPPAPPSVSHLPRLPVGWEWATLDGCAEVRGGVTIDQKRKHMSPARFVPYLRVANVQRGYLDLGEVKEVEASETDINDLALRAGDVLFNEGGDRDKLGRGWIWNCELPECIHQNHVFRARLLSQDLNPKFVSWYANTAGQRFFFDQGKHTTNLASISMSKLKALPIPVPPPAEQHRIVAEVERRFSVIEELEATVAANLQRAARLRQSILDRAFRGELVRDATTA